jgi:hypothetical protein
MSVVLCVSGWIEPVDQGPFAASSLEVVGEGGGAVGEGGGEEDEWE